MISILKNYVLELQFGTHNVALASTFITKLPAENLIQVLTHKLPSLELQFNNYYNMVYPSKW